MRIKSCSFSRKAWVSLKNHWTGCRIKEKCETDVFCSICDLFHVVFVFFFLNPWLKYWFNTAIRTSCKIFNPTIETRDKRTKQKRAVGNEMFSTSASSTGWWPHSTDWVSCHVNNNEYKKARGRVKNRGYCTNRIALDSVVAYI